MKILAILSFFVLSSSVFAASIPLRYTCQSGEDTVKLNLGEFRQMTMAYVEVYNQGGMGPDNLEYSAVATEQTPIFSAGQLVQIDIALPMGGQIFLDISHDLKKAVGVFKATNRAERFGIYCQLDPIHF